MLGFTIPTAQLEDLVKKGGLQLAWEDFWHLDCVRMGGLRRVKTEASELPPVLGLCGESQGWHWAGKGEETSSLYLPCPGTSELQLAQGQGLGWMSGGWLWACSQTSRLPTPTCSLHLPE
jgi:hypothetical protein